MPMHISETEVSHIRVGKLQDNSRAPSHNIAFISYKDDRQRLNAITHELSRETYSTPRDGAILQDRQVESRLLSLYVYTGQIPGRHQQPHIPIPLAPRSRHDLR